MSQELVPYQDIEKMGKAVATSGLFGVKTEAQAIALMLIAQAYGQHPAIAAMEYHIIAGKPSKKSEAMLASFIQAGGKIQWHKLDDTIAEATFSHPLGGELKLAWDIKMAEKAGLLSKEGTLYKKYPRAMLRSRLIAEGVRTIYPAATGGMLAKEEIEDIENIQVDSTKSRVENIVEEATIVKEETNDDKKQGKVKEDKSNIKDTPKKSSTKKETATDKIDSKIGNENILPEGHKSIIGLIDNTIQSLDGSIECVKISKEPIVNPNDGKASIKYSFLIRKNNEDKRYGTWDAKLAKEIMECVDQRILLKIEYKERTNDKGTLFNDIVSFKQATIKEMEDDIK